MVTIMLRVNLVELSSLHQWRSVAYKRPRLNVMNSFQA